LNVESVKELKRKLRDMGYSDGVIEEILKWYGQDNTTSK
jgi:SOS response regulatory protein OraA/RecX